MNLNLYCKNAVLGLNSTINVVYNFEGKNENIMQIRISHRNRYIAFPVIVKMFNFY